CQTTGDDQFCYREACCFERFDDDPAAERSRLEQCPVYLRRPAGQRKADDGAGKVVVDQHAAVPVQPVKDDEPVRPGGLCRRFGAQQLVYREPAAAGNRVAFWWRKAIGEPGEDVTDAALARLVSPPPGQDP